MFIRHRIVAVTAALIAMLGFAFGPTNATPAAAASTYFVIQPAHSLLTLDVEGASTANGARIIQWPLYPFNPPYNEQWEFISVSDAQNIYYIKSRNSGLVIEPATLNAGAQVIQHSLYYGTNQQWVKESLAGNLVKFRNVATGLYLDVSGYSYNAGAPLVVWYQTNGQNQQFFVAGA